LLLSFGLQILISVNMEPKDPKERKDVWDSFHLQKLQQETERLLKNLKDITNTLVGFLIFLFIPLSLNLLNVFNVLMLPLWLSIILWILSGIFVFGSFTNLFLLFTTRRKIQTNENRINTLGGFTETKKPIEYINQLIEINVSRLDEYYQEVKRHTFYSFSVALIVGVFGFALICFGIVVGYYKDNITIAYLSGASGIIVECISGVFFYLYNKTVKQLKLYHDNLIDLQNILLSFQLIDPIKKEDEKIALVGKVVDYLVGKQVYKEPKK